MGIEYWETALRERVRAICIDLDNTLWPVEEVIDRAEKAMYAWLQEHYPRVTETHNLESMRRKRFEVFREYPEMRHDFTFLRKRALETHAREAGYDGEVAEGAFEVFIHHRNQVNCYADVVPALESLAASYPLVAVTNGNADLGQIGLEHFFDSCVFAREVGALKPDAAVFHAAAERLGMAAGEVLHVGDDQVADVQGARDAGMMAIWLNRHDANWDLSHCVPDDEVRDLHELRAWLGLDGARGRGGDA